MLVCEVNLTGGLLKYQKYFEKIRLTMGQTVCEGICEAQKGHVGVTVLLSLCVFAVFSDKVI